MNGMADFTYTPIQTLKRIADDVWIVDGPAISFGPPGLKIPFPTRMTIVRLHDDHLFIHSPTPLGDDLKIEVERLGKPYWIIGPNRIHYWWIPEWKAGFPRAEIYLAPGIKKRAGKRIDFATMPLETSGGYPWDDEISTLPIAGSYMTEVEFFHHASRTLILTDLIENLEPQRLGFFMRWLTRLGGVLDPDGGMPRDLRLTFGASELRGAVEQMLVWAPERVILAHGRWYRRDGADELRRAFRGILEQH